MCTVPIWPLLAVEGEEEGLISLRIQSSTGCMHKVYSVGALQLQVHACMVVSRASIAYNILHNTSIIMYISYMYNKVNRYYIIYTAS